MSRLKRIVDAMGGQLMDGGRRALVRGPGHGPGDRSVSLLETEDGRVLIHCFSPRDDWRAVRDELADLGLLDEDGEHHPNAAPTANTEPRNHCTTRTRCVADLLPNVARQRV